MTRPLIGVATADDVEEIDRLLRALAKSTGESDYYAGNLQALAQFGFSKKPLFRTLLVKQGDSAIGLCTFFPEFSTWRCQPGLYVQDLYIDAQHRGGGLGRQLLSGVVRYASKEWQASYMRLSVLKTNQQGQAFYNTLGFYPDEENKLMLLQGDQFDSLK